MGSTGCSIIGVTATGAANGGDSVAAAACDPDCCDWNGTAPRDGTNLGSAVRSQYQKTNEAIDRRTTISSNTTGTSKPPGRTRSLASSRFSMVPGTTNKSLVAAIAGHRSRTGTGIDRAADTGAGCPNLGPLATLGGLPSRLPSGKDPAETFAAVRIPLNRPAQPRQYFARSKFAVWQDSQNFVMAMAAGRVAHGMGM
jgi:hypothetical protein